MAQYRVAPKVTYENTGIVLETKRKMWKVPKGVIAHEPIRLSWGEMSKKEPSKVPAPAGLTKSECEVEAPGIMKLNSDGGVRATKWQFVGGDIILNIFISIYIVDELAKNPVLFKLIMEHEYIHVSDTHKLADSFAGIIEADSKIRDWLKGEPWSGGEFFARIGELWGVEAKRLGDKLDSGPQYDKHKREIAKHSTSKHKAHSH